MPQAFEHCDYSFVFLSSTGLSDKDGAKRARGMCFQDSLRRLKMALALDHFKQFQYVFLFGMFSHLSQCQWLRTIMPLKTALTKLKGPLI